MNRHIKTISQLLLEVTTNVRVNRKPGGYADWFVAGLRQPKNSPKCPK